MLSLLATLRLPLLSLVITSNHGLSSSFLSPYQHQHQHYHRGHHQKQVVNLNYNAADTVVTTPCFGFRPIPAASSSSLSLANTTPDTIERPENEFSRVLRAEVVLGAKRGRDHVMNVRATAEELAALATRFDLPGLAKLEADLVLRRQDGDAETIFATGSVSSTLTQICVRTNQPFEVELNFELVAAARSVRDDGMGGGMEEESDDDDNYSRKLKQKQKKRAASKKNFRASQGRQIDEMGMLELQGLMTDLDYEDDLIEDDAVYQHGSLDAGELVAQMFRLKLDPYPKKPGSEPVKYSISG